MALSPFINDFPPNPIRNDFTGAAGYDFTVANETTVSHVGRPIGSVFTQSHQINIWDRSTQLLIAQASVSPTDPVIDGYAVAALQNALLLSPGTVYAITSDEYDGGDNWQNHTFVTGLSTGFTVRSQCYSTSLSAFPVHGGGESLSYRAYVWPNLYVTRQLSDNLQGWWCPSLDTSGNGTTTLTDLSGNGNNGTLTNMDASTDWVADTDSGGVRALDFDGIDDYVQIPLLVSGVTNFTVHWWQKLDVTSGYPTMVSFLNPYWHVPYNSNRAFYKSRPAVRPLITIKTGEWYSVAIVENGTNGKLYIDGVLAGTFTGGSAGDINSDPLFLGAQISENGYANANGCIDAVAVYSRALTADEVAQLYNGGRSLNLLASGSTNIATILASIKQSSVPFNTSLSRTIIRGA